jgi:hypothetical protein
MQDTIPSRLFLTVAVLSVGVAIACADNGPTVGGGHAPVAGLTRVESNDTGVTAPPPGPTTPGSFHGSVLGQAPAGSGPDTLGNAERLANVRVTAYPRTESTTDTLGVGPAAASVLTDATGAFQMPTLPGGEYVITFNPQAPEDTKYRGAWSIATIHDHSNDYPWLILLLRK